MKAPDIFSAIAHPVPNNTYVVVLNWTEVKGATGFTVFWCKGPAPHYSNSCDVSVAKGPVCVSGGTRGLIVERQ